MAGEKFDDLNELQSRLRKLPCKTLDEFCDGFLVQCNRCQHHVTGVRDGLCICCFTRRERIKTAVVVFFCGLLVAAAIWQAIVH